LELFLSWQTTAAVFAQINGNKARVANYPDDQRLRVHLFSLTNSRLPSLLKTISQIISMFCGALSPCAVTTSSFLKRFAVFGSNFAVF
jgi:hypothetical protein